MSKKTNTLWFILGATVFNVLSTVISFVVLFVLYFRFLSPMLPESAAPIGIIFVFIGAIALSFVLYRFILKRITAKIDLDKHFDPLFGRRRPRR